MPSGTTRVPTGTVTLLFTDIVDSCSLWEAQPEVMRQLIQRHLRESLDVVEEYGGIVFKTVGDAVCAAFPTATEAVNAAIRIQLRTRHLGDSPRLDVRMALHSGPADYDAGDYLGPTTNRVGRLVSLASGGQVLVSESTRAMADEGGAFQWHDHGEVQLKGMKRPVRVYQLIHPDLRPPTAGLPVLQVPNNLTDDERPFIGRARERTDVRRKLASGERLVTLTGMGGIGKTSLARQVAADAIELFPDGLWFVECESVATEADLEAAVSDWTGPIESLGERRMLVILDCFENITALAPWVDRLLARLPHLRVLVTSRVVLGLGREFEYALAPFATSGRDAGDSFHLFIEAARHVVDDFAATGKQRALVRKICESLEGVPLAIVLAAGRLRTLTLVELLDQIHHRRLDVLQRRGPASDRHRDLQDVIAGSFQLLDAKDQELLVRLSVFRGGFTMAMAEAVVPERRLLSGLTALREASLVITSVVGPTTRFRILDTVREYLVYLEREGALAATLAEDAARHADLFATRAEHLQSLERGGEWDAFVREFWADLGNVRLAIAFADLEGRDDLVIRFTRSMLRVFLVVGLWDDFDHLAEVGLRASSGDAELQAWIHMNVGTKHRRRGEEDAGRAAYLDRVAILRRLDQPVALADALSDLIEQSLERGRVEEAAGDLRELQSLAVAHPVPEVVGVTGLVEIRTLIALGDHDRARGQLEQASFTASESDDQELKLIIYGQLAEMAAELGEIERAREWGRLSLALSVQGERVYSTVRTLLMLAEHAPSGEAAMLLHIAHLVPIDPKSQLARRASEIRRAFARDHARALEDVELRTAGQTWLDLASALA